MLLRGRVKCKSGYLGLTSILEAGACFGESALVGERCRLLTVDAEEKSLLLQISTADVAAAAVDLAQLREEWVMQLLFGVRFFATLDKEEKRPADYARGEIKELLQS